MKITVGSTYHTIGTGNLVIGVMKKMGHSSLEEICIPSPLWPGPNKEITSTKVLNYSNIVDMTTSDKICVVLIRDVFDKWKSGYFEEFGNAIFTILKDNYGKGGYVGTTHDEYLSILNWILPTDPEPIRLWFDFMDRILEGYYKTFTVQDNITLGGLDIMGRFHDAHRGITWMCENHARFWKWNEGNEISLLEMANYENIYFLELKDLSSPRFLKWLQKKDEKWKEVKEIPHKNVSPSKKFWLQMELFWEEYRQGKILKDKKLIHPLLVYHDQYSRDLSADYHNQSVHFVTGRVYDYYLLLRRILKQEQEQVDFIREHDRYIRL